VNKIILGEANSSNACVGCYENWGAGVLESEPMMTADMSYAEAPSGSGSGSGSDSFVAKGVSESGSLFEVADNFEIYQHKKGAVKSDIVKSNGVHVFAAVDDRILVWDLEGKLSKTISMPSIQTVD